MLRAGAFAVLILCGLLPGPMASAASAMKGHGWEPSFNFKRVYKPAPPK